MPVLNHDFFNQNSELLARALLGKVIRAKYRRYWLSVQIIETEAYCHNDKASHGSLGYTEKRKALFMPPGTIYMYYSRGADSFNISAKGDGNAVLIKSGVPYVDMDKNKIRVMQTLNPIKNTKKWRDIDRLCSGQTLLCQSLNLKVKDWDQRTFDVNRFYIDDVSYVPNRIIQTKRLGIPTHRDAHLPYRFIDARYLKQCTDKGRGLGL